MQIPTEYVGRWSGEVTDNLVEKYDGWIVLDEDGGDTTYAMATTTTRGKLTIRSEKDGGLILDERLYLGNLSGSGMALSLKLDAYDKLKCVWRKGSKDRCKATMTRV